jgi:hypothetical protein
MAKKKRKDARGYSTTSIPSKQPLKDVPTAVDIVQVVDTVTTEILKTAEITEATKDVIIDYIELLSLAKKNATKLPLKQVPLMPIQLALNQENTMLEVSKEFNAIKSIEWTKNDVFCNYFRLLNLGLDKSRIFTVFDSSDLFDFHSLLMGCCVLFDLQELPLHWHLDMYQVDQK